MLFDHFKKRHVLSNISLCLNKGRLALLLPVSPHASIPDLFVRAQLTSSQPLPPLPQHNPTSAPTCAPSPSPSTNYVAAATTVLAAPAIARSTSPTEINMAAITHPPGKPSTDRYTRRLNIIPGRCSSHEHQMELEEGIECLIEAREKAEERRYAKQLTETGIGWKQDRKAEAWKMR
ncbi:MAG: hypothetical protein Q9164_001673 [Protoblastenia rupestris]